MRLSERIARLEWIGLHSEKRESIRAYCTRLQKPWTAVVLESYCEGRLDQLAADRTTPVSLMLENLNLTGHAIQIGSHWHPLFLGDDEGTNEKVCATFEANWRPHWEAEIKALKDHAARKAST